MSKVIGVGIALLGVFGICAVIACGPTGVSEGGECGGSQDDCGANLTCQPINGRGHSYCCPAPPESSNYQNCHASVPTDSSPR
jgi:hypothetical protein